jgi:inner membrane protein
MASVAHLAAGALCGALYARKTDTNPAVAVPAFAALALAPDLDFFALWADPAGTALEHRAMTHALSFAAVAGGLLGAIAGAGGRRVLTAALCAAALASHGLLDAFTNNGPGPQLLWPFTDAHVRFPWHPIPGTQSFQEYFTLAGVPVMVIEALMCAPLWAATALLLLSLRPEHRKRARPRADSLVSTS